MIHLIISSWNILCMNTFNSNYYLFYPFPQALKVIKNPSFHLRFRVSQEYVYWDIWCWSKKMQLVHFSPCQTSKHPFECSFIDYHMLKKTFSLNENMSDQFLQLMVIKTQQDLFLKSFGVWSFKMFKFIFYFLVLRSNHLNVANWIILCF
jgi:hypothetical protein